MIIERVTGKR